MVTVSHSQECFALDPNFSCICKDEMFPEIFIALNLTREGI